MRKAVVPIIIMSLFITGCWDLVEAEKLGMVTLIGIDAAENRQIRVLIQEMQVSKKAEGEDQEGGYSGKPQVEIYEATAENVLNAVEKINMSSFRLTNFSHTYVIVLSEELVKEQGVQPFIDFMERTPDIRRNVWLIVSKEGQFDKVLNPMAASQSNTEPGKVIMEIIKNKPVSSVISTNNLGDFMNLLWERGTDAYTSGIGTIKAAKGVMVNQGSGRDATEAFNLVLEDTAVFRKDKLAGWLNNEETKGLLWVKGQTVGGALAVRISGKEVSARIVRASSKINPQIKNGKMEVNIRIKVVSNLAESHAAINFLDLKEIEGLQKLQAEEIKKEILKTYEKLKQLKADVFGFGNYFFGKYPEVWKRIEKEHIDYLSKIKLNIDVEATVNNIGLVKRAASGTSDFGEGDEK